MASDLDRALAHLESGARLPREPHAICLVPIGTDPPEFMRRGLDYAKYERGERQVRRIRSRCRAALLPIPVPCRSCGEYFVRAALSRVRCDGCVAGGRLPRGRVIRCTHRAPRPHPGDAPVERGAGMGELGR